MNVSVFMCFPPFSNLKMYVCMYVWHMQISPYYSASVNGCSDCDIVIGAVFGAVIGEGCDNLTQTINYK